MPSEHSYSSGFTLLSKRKEGGPSVNIRSTIRQLQAYQQSNASYVPQLAETVQSLSESQMEYRLRAVAMANYNPQPKEPAPAEKHMYNNKQENVLHQYTSYTDPQNYSRLTNKKPNVIYNSAPTRGGRPAPPQRVHGTPPKAQRSPRTASPMRNASVLLDRDGFISSVERARFRGEVTKNLMDFFDETDELYECRENMRRQIFDAMRADPRYAKEMAGDVKLARRPTKEQLDALGTVETTLALLREATMELVATYLTPEEKRHLGINTHQFQSRNEKRTAYQYVNDEKRVRSNKANNQKSSHTSAGTSSKGYSREKGAVETPVSPGDEFSENMSDSPEQTEEPPRRSTATTEMADSLSEQQASANRTRLASSTSPSSLPRQQPAAAPTSQYRPSVPSSAAPPAQSVATSLFTPPTQRTPFVAPPAQSFAPPMPTTTTTAAQAEEAEAPETANQTLLQAGPHADPYAASETDAVGSTGRNTPERVAGPAPSVSTLDDGNGSLSSQGSPAAKAPDVPTAAGEDDMDIPVPSQPAKGAPPQGVAPRKVPPAFDFLFKKLPGGQMVKVAPAPGVPPASSTPPATSPPSSAVPDSRTAAPQRKEPTLPVRNEFKRFIIDSDSDSSLA